MLAGVRLRGPAAIWASLRSASPDESRAAPSGGAGCRAGRAETPFRWTSMPSGGAARRLRGRDPAAFGLVPGREDPRPGRRDGDRELEVRRQRPVLGVDRPVVVADAHGVAPGGDHRLAPEPPPPLPQG